MNYMQAVFNETTRPWIIAEVSGNHQQSLDTAIALIDAAADAGVDAVKFQTYTPRTMTLNVDRPEFWINDPGSLWDGRHLFELYQVAMTPWDWLPILFEHCRKRGVVPFSTPFDETAVDFLEGQLKPDLYKIASFELADSPLLMHIAKTGKPTILSTGMATEIEIQHAVGILQQQGCSQVTLLKCTSAYPAPAEAMNLATIPYLRERFKLPVGLSDHTLGHTVAVAAVALGASVIEKHIVLTRNSDAIDAGFSLEPLEFKQLVRAVHQAHAALGTISLGPTDVENRTSTQHRRSILAITEIQPGDAFTPQNTRCLRPGHGSSPKQYEHLLTLHSTRAYSPGDGIHLP